MLARILIIGTLLLGLYSEGTAATRYVSKNGDDAHTGASWSQAWLTLTNVNDTTRVLSGDTVFFGTGIWRGNTTVGDQTCALFPRQGSLGAPTVYADSAFAPGFPAKIYGSDSVGGWTVYSGNIWQASLNYAPEVVGYGDSILFNTTRINHAGTMPTYPGFFYSNGTTLYVWLKGNLNPNNYDMEASTHNVVVLRSTYSDNVELRGLEFRYGSNIFYTYLAGNNPDNVTISHCRLVGAENYGGANPSLIQIGAADNEAGLAKNWVIRACTLRTSIDPRGFTSPEFEYAELLDSVGYSSGHGSGLTIYGAKNMLIESCYVAGIYTGSGIEMKGKLASVYGQSDSIVIRYNTIDGFIGGHAILASWMHQTRVWVYGNVIKVTGGNFTQIGVGDQGGVTPVVEHVYILNNTFYNTRRAYSNGNEGGGSDPTLDKYFKYNVFYRPAVTRGRAAYDASVSIQAWDTTATSMVIDSNMYYTGDTILYVSGVGSVSLSSWRSGSIGHDIRSSFGVNPGFTDAANGNFSRPSAGTEMNETYGGRTWTKYGAIQGIPSTIPRIGVNPSSLTYTATQGSSNPASKTLTISNAGGGTLNWSASSGASWLSLSPGSGSGTGTVTASVSISGLSAGSFAANITISAAGADNTPLTVPVTLTVAAPDVTGPVITGVSGTGLATSASNTIVWQTNEPATSQVAYGLTVPYGSTTVRDETLVTDHAVDLFGLIADTVYHFQVISRDALGNQTLSSDYTFRTSPPSSNLALGRPVTVSGSYAGYGVTPINDGTIAASGGTSGTWASDQSASPHWVVVDLQTASVVRSVRIYWANNTGTSKYMRSLQFTVQYWDGAGYVDLVTVNNPRTDTATYPDTTVTYDSTGAPTGYSVTVAPAGDDVTLTAAGFPSVSTSRIRVYQPANQGPESYPSIMWLTELEIYSEDVAPPSAP